MLDMVVATTKSPVSRPRALRSRAAMSRMASPLMTLLLAPDNMQRSASPSKVRPMWALRFCVSEATDAGWRAPQPALMLRPSGAMLRRVTLPCGVEAAEELGGDGGGGSVGAIGNDAEAGEREAGDGVDEELDVVELVGGVVLDRRQFGGVGGGGLGGVEEDLALHGELEHVGELEAVGAEELDAVVLPGIVGGGDDDAGIEAVMAGEEGDGWGGDDARGLDLRACLRGGRRRGWRRSRGWTRGCRGRGGLWGGRRPCKGSVRGQGLRRRLWWGRGGIRRRRRGCRQCRRACGCCRSWSRFLDF